VHEIKLVIVVVTPMPDESIGPAAPMIPVIVMFVEFVKALNKVVALVVGEVAKVLVAWLRGVEDIVPVNFFLPQRIGPS